MNPHKVITHNFQDLKSLKTLKTKLKSKMINKSLKMIMIIIRCSLVPGC